MISKNLYVLTPVEQQELSLVDTTLSQAWQIYDRNMPLLEALYLNEEYEGEVGCPHCCEGYRCTFSKCKWLNLYREEEFSYGAPCCRQTFGGYAARDSSVVVGYGWCFEDIGYGLSGLIFNATETFLLGHIEWAQRLIDGEMPCVEETTSKD